MVAVLADQPFLAVEACQPGTNVLEPGEVGEDACVYLATQDGAEWFEPTGDQGTFVVYNPWRPLEGLSRIDGDILMPFDLPGNTSNGTPREPTGVAWQLSADGGRTFTEIATDDAVYSSLGTALSFTYQGAFRSIIWDRDGKATLRQLDDDLQWQPIGIATGLPAADRAWEGGDTQTYGAVGTPSGSVYVMQTWPESESAISFISRDGGLTWTQPDEGDLPFTNVHRLEYRWAPVEGVPRVPWVTSMGGWLMFNDDTGTYLTDGTDWYLLEDSAFQVERNGTSTRDPITFRLPAYAGP